MKNGKYCSSPHFPPPVRINEAADLAPVFETRQNLFIDTAGFMRGLFPVDTAYPYVKGQMVYGSNAPMSEMQSLTILVETAILSQQEKDTIFSGDGFLKFVV